MTKEPRVNQAAARAVAKAFHELERLGATVRHDVMLRAYFPKHVRSAEDQARAYRAVQALGRLVGQGGVIDNMVQRDGKVCGWHTRIHYTRPVLEALKELREKAERQGLK